jgi:hypothetical protein
MHDMGGSASPEALTRTRVKGDKMSAASSLPKCHGCGEELSINTDSEAHFIPNALGGRLKAKGLICRKCNTELDRLADNALTKAFGAWPTLLDVPRERGANPPKTIRMRSGRDVRLDFDGSLTAKGVRYDVEEIDDGHQIQVAAGDM